MVVKRILWRGNDAFGQESLAQPVIFVAYEAVKKSIHLLIFLG
jgi:hypothetical protein